MSNHVGLELSLSACLRAEAIPADCAVDRSFNEVNKGMERTRENLQRIFGWTARKGSDLPPSWLCQLQSTQDGSIWP